MPPAGLEKYCPVEYLYSREVLNVNNVLTKRNFNEFTNLITFSTPDEAKNLSEEYDKETSIRPFKVNDDKKNIFSEAVQSFTDPEVFKGFKPTLELIAAIVSR
jgi:hypothetical protein